LKRRPKVVESFVEGIDIDIRRAAEGGPFGNAADFDDAALDVWCHDARNFTTPP
jgi:hypothetical protein